MSEQANPPPEVVSRRDGTDTRDDLPGPPAGRSGAGPGELAAGPGELGAAPAQPEPPLSLKPPNARPTPPPLEADVVRIVVVGAVLWFAGFLVLLPFRHRLAAGGHEVWMWTCLAGGVLGLIGLVLSTRAAAARRRAGR